MAVALALAGCRQDMHDAPRYEPLEANTFFANGSASRMLVANTVPRGLLREDTHLNEGKCRRPAGRPRSRCRSPPAVMARGQERFNVFCSPCHGRTGSGNGMVVQRGFRAPPSYHEDRLRNAPVGYFFDVMTNGFGAMQDYASQVPVADRWAIAAYIRALQLSQRATLADVPANRRARARSPGCPRRRRRARRTLNVEQTSQPARRRPRGPAQARADGRGVGLVLCAIGFVVDRDHFFRSWLVAFLLFLGISLGSMALMMIQHLCGGAWGVFRRVFEASSRTLPLMAVLFLPVVVGMTSLYPWTHPDLVAGDQSCSTRRCT